jgi:hypothetical protein
VYDAIKGENERAARIDDADLASLAQTIRPGPARPVASSKAQGLVTGATQARSTA